MEACANCGTQLTGPFCARCGQEHLATEPSVHQVFADAWEEIVKVDGKIFATVKLLLSKPGQLTLEFFEGRRIRYVTPIKLYLTCSALFFLVANLSYVRAMIEKGKNVQINSTSPKAQELLTHAASVAWSLFFDHLAVIYILIVPLTALVMALLFRGAKRTILFHLVFVLHAWSALFLGVSLLAALHIPINFLRLFFVVSLVYMIPATRRTFSASWLAAILKSLCFSVFTLFLTGVAIAGLVLAILIPAVTDSKKLPPAQVGPGYALVDIPTSRFNAASRYMSLPASSNSAGIAMSGATPLPSSRTPSVTTSTIGISK